VNAISASILSGLRGEQLEAGERLLDFMNPLMTTAIEIATGRNGFGQQTSFQTSLADLAVSMLPYGIQGLQIRDPSKISKAYTDKSWEGVLKRKFLRSFDVEDVSIARLNEAAEARGKPKNVSQKIKEAQDDIREQAKEFNMFVPNSVLRALAWKTAYTAAHEERIDEVKDKADYVKRKDHPLTPREEAELAYATVVKYAPGHGEGLPTPDMLSPKVLDFYADAILYGSKEEHIIGLFQPWVDFSEELSKARAEKKEAG